MKLEAPFKPGNRIYFVGPYDVIKSTIIVSTKLIFISEVDRKYSVRLKKWINTVNYKFSEMHIFTDDNRQFTHDGTTPTIIFKSRADLKNSTKYKNHMI